MSAAAVAAILAMSAAAVVAILAMRAQEAVAPSYPSHALLAMRAQEAVAPSYLSHALLAMRAQEAVAPSYPSHAPLAMSAQEAVAPSYPSHAPLAMSAQEAVAPSYLSYSRALRHDTTRILLDEPTLPPLAHTRFCLQFPADCDVRGMPRGGGQLELTAARLQQLSEVNSNVNGAIRPERKTPSVIAGGWLIAPHSGDCNDYAVTKRHELLRRGWPSSALLLAEVVTSWGEHHLVLVVRTSVGDLVADNLSPQIHQWHATGYRWVRMQSPEDPGFWSKVAAPA